MDLDGLKASYEAFQDKKWDLTREAWKKYTKLADEAVKVAVADAEREFAGAVRTALEEGVTGAEIRTNVLHTQDWSTWMKWRDLAKEEN